MNQQRAATKSVGSRVRQTCGQRGRRVQLAVLESRVKLGSCLTLACLVSTWGRCLTLSFAGEATWDRHARCFPWWEVINKHHDFSTELDAWIALFCEFLQEIPSINQGHTHIHSNSKMIIAHPCFVSLQATMHAVLHVNEDNKKQSRDGPEAVISGSPLPSLHLSAACLQLLPWQSWSHWLCSSRVLHSHECVDTHPLTHTSMPHADCLWIDWKHAADIIASFVIFNKLARYPICHRLKRACFYANWFWLLQNKNEH